jgi:hypothetical protein
LRSTWQDLLDTCEQPRSCARCWCRCGGERTLLAVFAEGPVASAAKQALEKITA